MNGDLQDSDILMTEWGVLVLEEDSHDGNVGSDWTFAQHGTTHKDITVNESSKEIT